MRNYPHSEATVKQLSEAIELAKHCEHENTKFVETEMFLSSKGVLIDADTVEVCTNYYCGAIVRSGL